MHIEALEMAVFCLVLLRFFNVKKLDIELVDNSLIM